MTTRHTLFAALVPALLVAALLTGCTSKTPSATPTPTATPSPSPTPLLPQASGAIPPAVAQVVVAMTTHKPEDLTGLVAYQQVACTTAQGAGGPPKCKTGDSQGTVYRVFATGGCEGEWVTDARPILKQIADTSGPLFAVVKLTRPNPDPEPGWPKGDAAMIYNAGSGAGGYFVVADAQIVRAHTYCGAPAIDALLKQLGATEFYVAPPGR
ncbi:MAG: hypothetical protein WCQ48_03530 [Chloroflexota bacterium]